MKELRVAHITTETRAEGAAAPNALVLTGTPIVFNTPTVINDPRGSYTEIIERGALDGADISDTRLLVGHDKAKVPLARAPKTMQLTITERGLEMRAELADTADARAVYTAVERGDLDGMSFAFKVPEGGDSYDRATNTRTIHRIEKIYEVSVVAFPAYPTASVEAREALDILGDAARLGVLLKINKLLFKGDQVKKKRNP